MRKVWRQLLRDGYDIARCTVARLMRAMGLRPHRRLAGNPTAHAGFVQDALDQALYDRRPAHRGGLVHHSDRGSQYMSIRYSERLAEAVIEPSLSEALATVTTALAETINGVYEAEVIHRRGPWRKFKPWSSSRLNGLIGSPPNMPSLPWPLNPHHVSRSHFNSRAGGRFSANPGRFTSPISKTRNGGARSRY